MSAIQMNVFRVLGDVSHSVSVCILIWSIHANKSAEGVSLITQVFYAVVFCSRYPDLFWVRPGFSYWNFVLKIFFISSSLYIVFLMMQIYARTREREKAWKFGAACLAGSLVVAPFAMMIFDEKDTWSIITASWDFSLILESVCVLPQLLLLRQTTVPTVIDSFYLATLGSYRAFYILNWITRYFNSDRNDVPELIAVIFGIVQTAFYVDFAWVYYTRQRVKLRNGGVVDSEDLSRGWLVGKMLGRRVSADLEEHGDMGVPRGGLSVSADDDDGFENQRLPRTPRMPHTPADAAKRPDETGAMLADDSDDDSDDGVLPHHAG